ncbi:MAG: hypothetical protein HYW26_00855 [Candidatus Aenigmarchaeota archaeon]|nr:hypothetical protein [Candidatus Aenigmarchaeota archaeon]
MPFYDMHVHTTLSIGENTLGDIADFAKKLGLNGLGIVRYYSGGKIEQLAKRSDIDIVDAVMLKPASPEELNRLAEKVRARSEILMVHGGNYDVNRAACENPLIDVLCHPELGRNDSGIDHIVAKAAAENDVAVEINFREVLESYKRQRVHILSSMRKNVKLCEKYEAKIITASGAISKWNMRPGRDLAALSHLLGLELGKAIDTVTTIPEEMVRANREKLEGKRWEGVSIVEEGGE